MSNEIMENIRFFVQPIGVLVGAFSLSITAYSVLQTRKEVKQSRDLQITLKFSEEFRNRWEYKWRDSLKEIRHKQKVNSNEVPEPHREELVNMLNWIDWLGMLIVEKCLTNENLILGSISPQLRQIINAGQSIINKGNPHNHWKGLVKVGCCLNIKWVKEIARNGRFESLRNFVFLLKFK